MNVACGETVVLGVFSCACLLVLGAVFTGSGLLGYVSGFIWGVACFVLSRVVSGAGVLWAGG